MGGYMEVKKLLEEADARLDKVAVTGTDVFLLADARRLLKTAYDQLGKEREGVENG